MMLLSLAVLAKTVGKNGPCRKLQPTSRTTAPRAANHPPSTAHPRRRSITMSFVASRAVVRQSQFAVRRAGLRNASTTSQAAGAAKEKAAEVSSKASEGLSKVQSSASSVASQASNAAGKAQGKASGIVGRVQG
jgi:hypothetical protein